jgi:putative glycosyl hydrolase-like family 15 (GHL15) protein
MRGRWAQSKRGRRLLLTLMVPAIVLATGPSSSPPGPSAPPSPSAPTSPSALHRQSSSRAGKTAGLLGLDHGDLSAASHLGGYGYVVLNAWEYRRIPALKAAHSGVKVLVYKDMSSTRSYACRRGVDQDLLPTGVGYCRADRNHPEWFLLDQNNRRIQWRRYPGHWWMDVGNSAYQNTWTTDVTAELNAKGWDGVMIDNAIVNPVYYLQPRESIPRYPTTAAYTAATQSYLANVGPKLQAAGFEVIPNIGGADASPSVLSAWVQYTSGVEREFWGRYGRGDGSPFGGWDWDRQMLQMDAVEAQGKVFLAVTYGATTNTQLMRYARASFLLGWDGGPDALFYRPRPGLDPWAPDWTIKIGRPLGVRYHVGMAWRRDFSRGVALVNPTSASVTVPLGGSYSTQDGEVVRSVTLGPRSGAVLREIAIDRTNAAP